MAEHAPSADLGDEAEAERQHFVSILRAFQNYRSWALAKVAKLEADYARLSPAHRDLVRCDDKVRGMRAAIEQNASVLDLVVGPHLAGLTATGMLHQHDEQQQVLVQRPDGSAAFEPASKSHYVSEADMEKVQSTLKQFVREWGGEGIPERDDAHGPLLEVLAAALPTGGGARVLVPGAGLGRLVWEIAKLGHVAQGCEFSYFMLVASNFILNGLQRRGSVTVHPWALITTNVVRTSQQLRPATIPDAAPWSLPHDAHLSMCAGDFIDVYRDQSNCWDAIVSSFFIDTAHDVTKYVARIRSLLTPGGVWLNLGPLLWHYHDMPGEPSVELSWEELRAVIVHAGFVFEREEWRTCRCAVSRHGRDAERIRRAAYDMAVTRVRTGTQPTTRRSTACPTSASSSSAGYLPLSMGLLMGPTRPSSPEASTP